MNHATPQGTTQYLQRSSSPQVRLGRTGFMISPVGFGGYRVHDREPEHRAALELALRSGCNLIDTSTNYTNGGSERLIGQVLGDFFRRGELKRDEIVVVTKAGYLQGDNLETARAREKMNASSANEIVKYSDDCWHSMAPAFLEEQIGASLARLGLETIDVLLLHNPEYFLKVTPDHTEYYRRLKLALAHLEEEVTRGRIQYYGISSNTFPEPRESPEFTSLDMVMELAEQVSARHHFAVIQFPMNLYEPGAALEENNAGMTLLDFAAQKDLGTLVNRPLNAYDSKIGRMVRLADFPSHEGVNVAENFRAALGKAIELESQYKAKDVVPLQQVAWGHIINSNIEKIRDFDSWKQILRFEITPILSEALHELSHEEEHREWAQQYAVVSKNLFDRFGAYFEWREAQLSRKIARDLDTAAPALEASKTLSQKVIRVYRSLPGVHGVLVGMRKPEYVRDALDLKQASLPAELALRAIAINNLPETASPRDQR